jgi:hypothetical protein
MDTGFFMFALKRSYQDNDWDDKTAARHAPDAVHPTYLYA